MTQESKEYYDDKDNVEAIIEEKEEKVNLGKEILSMIMYFGMILLLTYLIVNFVGQRTQVSGSSMEPTLTNGDNLIVDKITYRFREPQRFDVIVFPYQNSKTTFYIKRIIGLPGETVQIIDGDIYIDGEILEENYGREIMTDSGRATEMITLDIDEYFVLGDNRNHSSDSREYDVGNIDKDSIVGRALVKIWPINKIGILKHE